MEFLYLMFKKCNVGLLLTLLMIQMTSGFDLNVTLSIRKCQCNKYEAWDGTTCLQATTVLPIFNSARKVNPINIQTYGIGVFTSSVENVSVKQLECPEDLFLSTLQVDSIILLPDGRLVWLETNEVFTDDVFCVEHILEDGEAFLEAKVCLPPPSVTSCCPLSHLLDRDGSCHPRENLHPPPILLTDRPMNWSRVHGNMETPKCNEHEYLRQIPLRPTEGQLGVDRQHKASLNWIPKDTWVPFFPWRNKYCVALQETETGDLEYVAQICWKDHVRYHEQKCNSSACISKCCVNGTLLHNDYGCIEAFGDENWAPSQIPDQQSDYEWNVLYGEPGCKKVHSYDFSTGMYILPNGFLQLMENKPPPVPPSRYCIDNILLNNGSIAYNVAMVCASEIKCLWRDTLIKVTLGISYICLIVTLCVYLGVPELRDHTYGRCLISMITAMLIGFAGFLFVPQGVTSGPSCYSIAFFKHFGAMAMFFWLNVMCFDMWKIIRGSTVQHHSLKTFVGYSVYAWGCPTIITTVTLILDTTTTTTASSPSHNIILPEFYKGLCWFHGDQAYWAYFSGIILVLVVVNLLLFLHVAVTLWQKMKQRTRNFETSSSRSTKITKTKHQVWLFTKLFVVMGVMWIADVLSVITHRKTCSYWVFTDIVNSLQGFFIFVVVVCNKDNLKKIKNAWRPKIEAVRQRIFSITEDTSQRGTRTNLSIDYTDASRKTSTTSLPRKISQVSNILFPGSSKKTATINPTDGSEASPNERKVSNVSIKEVVPLRSLE